MNKNNNIQNIDDSEKNSETLPVISNSEEFSNYMSKRLAKYGISVTKGSHPTPPTGEREFEVFFNFGERNRQDSSQIDESPKLYKHEEDIYKIDLHASPGKRVLVKKGDTFVPNFFNPGLETLFVDLLYKGIEEGTVTEEKI